MRRVIKVLFFLVVCLFSTSTAPASVQEFPIINSNPFVFQYIVDHLKIINEWFDDAYEFAGNDKEALSILKDLESRAFPVVPDRRPDRKGVILLGKKPNGIAILALKDSINIQWKAELNAQTLIQFTTINEADDLMEMFVLHEHYEPSRLIRALTLLQQAYYVKYAEEKIEINYKHKRCFDMLFRLLTKKFGAKYTTQVRNRIENKPVDLDGIYGQASVSKVEEDTRRALLYIQAEFTIIREQTYYNNDKALLNRLRDFEEFANEN